eukprot:588022-Pyramimonas_sp.AAC.1
MDMRGRGRRHTERTGCDGLRATIPQPSIPAPLGHEGYGRRYPAAGHERGRLRAPATSPPDERQAQVSA